MRHSIQKALAKMDNGRNLFAHIAGPKRIAILFPATCLLVFKLYRFYRLTLFPKIAEITSMIPHTVHEAGYHQKIASLVYFDILVVISGVLFFFAVLFLFSGSPGRAGVAASIFKGRAGIAFFITAPIFLLLLCFSTTVLPNLFFTYKHTQGLFVDAFDVSPRFLHEAMIAGVCLAIAFADTVCAKKSFRWWGLLFLFAPGFSLMPLLWANAFSALLPSRYWSFWRPVLFAATCLPVILVFPLAQPIKGDLPVKTQSAGQVLSDCDFAYQAQLTPDQKTIYLRCGEIVNQYEKTPTGSWEKRKDFYTGFQWNRGTFDFERNRVYIFDFINLKMRIFSLPGFDQTAETELPLVKPETILGATNTLQAAAFDENIILGCNNWNALITVDLNDFSVLAKKQLLINGTIWDLAYDPAKKQFLVLTNQNLYCLSLKDLSIMNTVRLRDAAYEMLLDQTGNRIFLSMPQKMQVLILDRNSLKEIGRVDAPAGVRTLAMDTQNGLLFFGAVSGVVEIRRADTLAKISRIRLSPWIHWICPISNVSQAVVTMGDLPAVIIETDQPSPFDFVDLVLRAAENIGRPIVNGKNIGAGIN